MDKPLNLKAFFYLLLRDELPFGKVERILKEIRGGAGARPEFEDVNLANYVESLANEFIPPIEEVEPEVPPVPAVVWEKFLTTTYWPSSRVITHSGLKEDEVYLVEYPNGQRAVRQVYVPGSSRVLAGVDFCAPGPNATEAWKIQVIRYRDGKWGDGFTPDGPEVFEPTDRQVSLMLHVYNGGNNAYARDNTDRYRWDTLVDAGLAQRETDKGIFHRYSLTLTGTTLISHFLGAAPTGKAQLTEG